MSGEQSLLRLEGIDKSFFGIPVLRLVSLELGEGRVLGLIGENGAGKSTLMNILGGVLRPDAGEMLISGRPYEPRSSRDASAAGIAFVHQELNLFTNLSIAENLYIERLPRRRLGGLRLPWVDRREMRRGAGELLSRVRLDCPPQRIVSELSPGERQLVEIARAIGSGARIIILDEPTTSLTAPEAQRLFELIADLRQRGVSIIYISHRLEDVFRLCDDLLVLRDGQVVGAGAVEEFTVPRAISLMVGRTIDQLFPQRTRRPALEPVLEVRGLGRRGVLHDVTFSLHPGEVLGVAGLMGAGRTELARTLFGLDPHDAGRILFQGKRHTPAPRRSIARGMALLTEDRRQDGLLMDASILFNASLAALPDYAIPSAGWVLRRRLAAEVAQASRATRLAGADLASQAAKTLSGGNQQKVVLAKWLLRKPALFILDEPTRGIDVGAKQEVYRIVNELAERGTGILMISSEIEELIGLCDRILVMAGGRICDEVSREQFDRERILRSALQGGCAP